VLILMTGLPGTGKSTVAAALARELGTSVLSTDRIRAEKPAPRRFTTADKGGVYERMFTRAARRLSGGRPVILDGTFYLERLRRAGAALGRRAGVPVFVVEVTAPLPIVKRRMGRRLRSARGPAPAAFRVHAFIRRSFEPVRGRHFVIDTAVPAQWKRDLASIANAMRVVANERAIITPLRRSRPLRLIQTHISWVLLDGARAYKIKKPVRFSFVDYTTPARRLAYCRREIAANARLSPDLYLGIVPVRDDGGTLSFGGPGRTVDHAVEMREMPQEARLDRMISSGRAGARDIRRIVAALCAFHAGAGRAALRSGSTRVVRGLFEHAFRLRPLIEREFGAGAVIDRVRAKVDGFLRAKAALFRERVRQDRIRRCHGDLRMSNIFLEAGRVRISDAVEFNPGLASTDVAADVCFLAMDLAACGERPLSEILIDSYIECSGDAGLRAVADFYLCYRALVRLLVESLAVVDPTIPALRKRRGRRAARSYLGLADEFAGRL
jgi:aminoglycoside phosphotransferase family enzyme/predicted kinase